ncbi:MAG: helix-turn-helix domain-containing protein [Bacteroidaceae bacterium]|nr:helix-turn-helix domain-containing protein [Prevotellaceae bacterium]MDY5631917.1 helix-turn-helix domain-containing protein [Bacteroidaceae bacterium]
MYDNKSHTVRLPQSASSYSIPPDVADQLYDKILEKLTVRKIYRQADFTAAQLVRELQTNNRYLAIVLRERFGKNFSQLMNEYRVREACFLLRDRRYTHLTIEQVAHQAGFGTRQSFHKAFRQQMGCLPNDYRNHQNQ